MLQENTLESLGDIRSEIDRIDDEVHSLLMERASLVASVARAKRGDGMQIVQPAREARLLRRLLSRHEGPLPRRTVVRIWRELISSVSLLQTGLSVVVADEDGMRKNRWDMAKNYFGTSLPMRAVGGLQNTMAEVVDGNSYFAVMPWPELEDEAPWWMGLFNRQGHVSLSIIGALPYNKTEGLQNPDVYDKAVIVSKISFMDSDHDNSFIGLEVDSHISRARIHDSAKAAGLRLINICSASPSDTQDSRSYLLLVEGYVVADSEELRAFSSSFSNACYYCDVVGGYPVIPDSED